jgi:hypothetical protein
VHLHDTVGVMAATRPTSGAVSEPLLRPSNLVLHRDLVVASNGDVSSHGRHLREAHLEGS